MHCEHCKKEQETIKIAGKTYCANCSAVLIDTKTPTVPKHKMPTLEVTDNKIRTDMKPSEWKEIDPEVRELSRSTKLPEVSKDDLEGSAILLDILKDNATESSVDRTIEQDKKLEKATEQILNIAASAPPYKPTGTENTAVVMNDITNTRIGRRKDYVNKKHKSIMRQAEEEIKEETENAARIVHSETGYTREYDLMLMSIALTGFVLIILVIFMTFR